MNVIIYEYSIIIACAFACVYSLSWGFTRDNFNAYKKYYNIGLGLFFSILSTGATFVMGVYNSNNVLGDFIFLTPVIFYFCISFFTPIVTSSIFLFFNIANYMWQFIKIPYVYFYSMSSLTMYLLISIYIVILSLTIIKKIFNKYKFKIKDIEIIAFMTLILFFIDIIIKYALNVSDNVFNFKLNIWFVFLFFTYSSFCVIVDSIYYHAVKLSNVVKYDDEYYLNNENIQNETIKFLGENKVKHAMYVNFFIKEYDEFENFISPKIRESIISFITDRIYKKVTNKINVKSLFFKNNRKTYGILIPIDYEISMKEYSNNHSIKNSESYKMLKSILKLVPTKYKIENYELRLTIKAVCSIYGLDSNNINNLFDMNNWYISNNEKTEKSILTVVDTDEYNRNKKTKRNVLALAEMVNINEIDISYDPIYDLSEKKYIGYISRVSLEGSEIVLRHSNKMIAELENIGMLSTLIRYIAFKEIKLLNNNMISNRKYYIDYDALILSSADFNIEEFMEKIIKNNINVKNTILNINNIYDVENFEILSDNIIKLKEKGIKICANDFITEFDRYEVLSKIFPDYLYIDNEVISKINDSNKKLEFIKTILKFCEKMKCKPIATNIKKFNELIWYKKQNVKLVSGELIGTNVKINSEQSEELKYLLQKV